MGDNSNPWAVGVLGQLSQLLGDFDDIVGAPAVALGVGTSLSFVAESVVRVGQDSVELFLEELRNERSGEGKHEDLYLANLISIVQKNLDQKTKKKKTHTLFFAAASSARAKIAGTETVKW